MTLPLLISAHLPRHYHVPTLWKFHSCYPENPKERSKDLLLMEQKKKMKRRREGSLELNFGERRSPSGVWTQLSRISMNIIAPCSLSTQLPLLRCPIIHLRKPAFTLIRRLAFTTFPLCLHSHPFPQNYQPHFSIFSSLQPPTTPDPKSPRRPLRAPDDHPESPHKTIPIVNTQQGNTQLLTRLPENASPHFPHPLRLNPNPKSRDYTTAIAALIYPSHRPATTVPRVQRKTCISHLQLHHPLSHRAVKHNVEYQSEPVSHKIQQSTRLFRIQGTFRLLG